MCRDIFSRIIHGSRIMLTIVSIAVVMSGLTGAALGLLGVLDRFLSFIMDSIYAFPSLILAIALSVALGPSPVNAAIAITVVYISTYFRMVRGQVLRRLISKWLKLLGSLLRERSNAYTSSCYENVNGCF